MDKKDLGFALIAQWSAKQQHGEPPAAVAWSDGTPATIDDFKKHKNDTHMFVHGPNGTSEQRMLPNVIADVAFDEALGVWVVAGNGVTPVATFLADREAPRYRIVAELRYLPIHYRCKIHWPEIKKEHLSGKRRARGRSVVINLYWITAYPNDHDWLIYAPTIESAAEFHEAHTGAKLRRSLSRRVLKRVDLSFLEELEPPPCYATLVELSKLGFRVLESQKGTKAVALGNLQFVEGNRYTRVPEIFDDACEVWEGKRPNGTIRRNPTPVTPVFTK